MASINHELSKATEYIKGKLYYVALSAQPKNNPNTHYVCTDKSLIYWNFFLDFGPLNLGQVYRFCEYINFVLHDPSLEGKRVVYYSSKHPHRRCNSIFLLCCYGVLYMDLTPEKAFEPFANVFPPLPPFHDATPLTCSYNLSVLDCLRGLFAAKKLNFFNFDTFDVEEYERYDKVENGDLNWIVAGKFIAFAGPHNANMTTPEGYTTLAPEDYIPYFKKRGVTNVIRLNKKYYDSRRFESCGIALSELYYLDGSNPPEKLLQRFLKICENAKGAIAVHCKAGLGRTGTCIGAYLMKHYKLSAAEVIGWMRICRPGSVIGPQQQFLEEIQQQMWREGETFRATQGLSSSSEQKEFSPFSTMSSMGSLLEDGDDEDDGGAQEKPLRRKASTPLVTGRGSRRTSLKSSQGDRLLVAKRSATPSTKSRTGRLLPLQYAVSGGSRR